MVGDMFAVVVVVNQELGCGGEVKIKTLLAIIEAWSYYGTK